MSKEKRSEVEQKQLAPAEGKAHPPSPLLKLPTALLLVTIDFISFCDIRKNLMLVKAFHDAALKYLEEFKPVIIEVKQKSRVSLLDTTYLDITNPLSDAGINQFIRLLPRLNRLHTIITPEGAPYADLCRMRERNFFKLTPTNLLFSLPLLKHFTFRTLQLDIGDSQDQVSPKVLTSHFNQLAAALPAVSILFLHDAAMPLKANSSFEQLNEQKHSHYFNPLLAKLAEQGKLINRPLQIKISGILSIQQMNLLSEFLQNNPAIHMLEIHGKIFKDKNEDSKELFVGLKETSLVSLNISASLPSNTYGQLGENLPDSLESLRVGRLENANLQALAEKLAGRNIKSLSFIGELILDFSLLLTILPKMPLLTELVLNSNPHLPNSSNWEEDQKAERKDISQILKLCSQSTSKITALNVDYSSKLIPDMIDVIECSPSLRRLEIYVNTQLSDPTSKEWQPLIEAAKNNFNLIEFNLTSFGDPHCPTYPHFFDKRNFQITEIKEMLADIKSSRSKWGLIPGKIDKLLTREIPEKIQSILDISSRLASESPQAHKKCQEICAGLQAETDELLRHRSAAVIQNSFRLLCATNKVMDVSKRINKIVPATTPPSPG